MDFDSYADHAVRLANHRADGMAAARDLLPGAWWADHLTPADLPVLRRAADGLRATFTHAAAGDDQATVTALNALLADHPITPRISGHDSRDWHIHVTGSSGTENRIGAEYAAGAIFGLAVAVTRFGSRRLGICGSPTCDNAYLDTSTNQSKRYCSDRCATRAHVAAHRARKKAAAGTVSTRPAAGQ